MNRLIVVLLAISAAALVWIAFNPTRPTAPPAAKAAASVLPAESGQDPYTPTKLEWLCAEAQVVIAPLQSRAAGYFFATTPQYPDTILVTATIYSPEFTDPQEVTKSLYVLRARILASAAARGWDWVRVDVATKAP